MNKFNTDHVQCHDTRLDDTTRSLLTCPSPVSSRLGRYDLSHLLTDQVGEDELNDIWLWGSFLKDLQVEKRCTHADWIESFQQICRERDILSLGPRVHVMTLRRLWIAIAYSQGAGLKVAALAKDLGLSVRTISRLIDIFVDLDLVRLLQPWRENVGKRLVKSPKVFVRDSGLVHALLGIESKDVLLGHSVVSRSWEGFCLETLFSAAPKNTEAFFYRTSAGTQIDLVLRFPNKDVWAFEIKRTTVAKASRGLHTGAEDIKANRKILIYLGEPTFIAEDDLRAISLAKGIFAVRRQAVTAADSTFR
jgi:predicted AAA+ superfamily ATPase